MNKRFLVVAAILATLALTVVGCAVKDDAVVGSWEGSSGTFQMFTFEFNNAGRGQYWMTAMPSAKVDFDWSLSGKTLTMNLGKDYGKVEVEIKISGSTMKWELNGMTYSEFKKK